MRALAEFGTPMLIGEGYRTFPVTIFNEFISEIGGDDGFAAAISIVAIVITTFVFLMQRYFARRRTFTMDLLNKIRPEEAKGIKRILVHVYPYTLIGISIMPQIYIFYTSFKNVQGLTFAPGYSLQSYYAAFDKVGSAIINTIKIPSGVSCCHRLSGSAFGLHLCEALRSCLQCVGFTLYGPVYHSRFGSWHIFADCL